MANPNTIDWLYAQDIHNTDASTRLEYEEYFESQQFAKSLQLLKTLKNTTLKGKASIADFFKKITDGILVLERFFKTNVTDVLASKLQDFNANVGTVIYKNNYNSATQYQPNNMVLYNNKIYICKTEPPVGTLPTNTTYWASVGLQGQQGQKGADSIDVVIEGNWSSSKTYDTNDIVIYDDIMYVALKSNSNVKPGTDATNWSVFYSLKAVGVVVGRGQILLDLLPKQVGLSPTVENWETEKEVKCIPVYKGEVYNTMFTISTSYGQCVDKADWIQPLTKLSVILSKNNWSSEETPTYLFQSNAIKNARFPIKVLPSETITEEQYEDYNKLIAMTPNISQGNITFNISSAPVNDIPITLFIQ